MKGDRTGVTAIGILPVTGNRTVIVTPTTFETATMAHAKPTMASPHSVASAVISALGWPRASSSPRTDPNWSLPHRSDPNWSLSDTLKV